MNAVHSSNPAPTNATQAKDRLYSQLSNSLGRMSRAISQTADLCEQLQVDLHSMRAFAGLDAAKSSIYLLIRVPETHVLFQVHDCSR